MTYDERKGKLREDIRKDSNDKVIIHEDFQYGYRENSHGSSDKTAGYTAMQASENGGKTNRSTKKSRK